MQTFTAFGVTRRSDQDRSWASQDADGTVRFHATQDAARRAAGRFGRVAATTAAAAASAKAAKTCDRCGGSGVDPVRAGGTVSMPCQRCSR